MFFSYLRMATCVIFFRCKHSLIFNSSLPFFHGFTHPRTHFSPSARATPLRHTHSSDLPVGVPSHSSLITNLWPGWELRRSPIAAFGRDKRSRRRNLHLQDPSQYSECRQVLRGTTGNFAKLLQLCTQRSICDSWNERDSAFTSSEDLTSRTADRSMTAILWVLKDQFNHFPKLISVIMHVNSLESKIEET